MIDVISIGRLTVDLISKHENIPLKDETCFLKYLGGSSANYAIACSRLLLDTAMISRVGKDDFAEFLLNRLNEEGVNTKYIKKDPQHNTATSFVSLFPPENFPILYYRENCADIYLKISDLPKDLISNTKVLFASGTILRHSPARGSMLSSMQKAKESGAIVILDIDYRKYLWHSPKHLGVEIRAACNDSNIIIGNEGEIRLAGGEKDTIYAAEMLLKRVPTVILKLGKKGAILFNKGQKIKISGYSVPVINGLGAGDGFAAGVTFGLIHGMTLSEGVRLGNVIGAIVVGKHSCSDAMPLFSDIINFLNKYSRGSDKDFLKKLYKIGENLKKEK